MGEPNELQKIYNHVEKEDIPSFLQIAIKTKLLKITNFDVKLKEY